MRLLGLIAVILFMALGVVAADRLRKHLSPADHLTEAAEPGDAPAAREAMSHVQVVTPRHGVIAIPHLAFGSIEALEQGRSTITTAVDVRIRTVLVAVGDPVAAGQVVALVDPTADALQASGEALAQEESARGALTLAQQRLALHLGTTLELQQAVQALAASGPKAAFWRAQGDPTHLVLRAPQAGILAAWGVHAGDQRPAGTELGTVVGAGVQARLGFDPALAPTLTRGAPIAVTIPGLPGRPAVAGIISSIAGSVAPDTRLLEVLVPLGALPVPSGSSCQGQISLPSPSGWICPRQAVQPSDAGSVLVTVDKGVARRHIVTVVAENDREVVILDGDLAAGAAVVVLGNFSLPDGTAVTTERAP